MAIEVKNHPYQAGQDVAETTADLEEAVQGIIDMTGASNLAEAIGEVLDGIAKYQFRIDRRGLSKADAKRFARRFHNLAADIADAQYAEQGR